MNKLKAIFILSLFFTPDFSAARICAQQNASATTVVDKMVATVNGNQLITYTDLLWQLALQPATSQAALAAPRAEDLQRALQSVIDQILITQEAEKLPSTNPTDEEVKNELTATIKRFPSQDAFYQRINRVGLSSEQLTDIIRRRVAINKYLDFRFRSFIVVTATDVEDYYRNVYLPRARAQSPGQVVKTLDQAREEIRRDLTEDKIESETNEFLDDARGRAEIIYLGST